VAPPVIAPSQPAGSASGSTQPVAASRASSGTGGLSTTQRRVLAGVVLVLVGAWLVRRG
jgi:hypothetical protein